jgi:hypothetical protein
MNDATKTKHAANVENVYREKIAENRNICNLEYLKRMRILYLTFTWQVKEGLV